MRSRAWEGNPDNQRRAWIVVGEVAARCTAGMKILDVGCGSGWFTLELARYGEVTGVDLASATLARLDVEHPEVSWRGGDFLSLELPEGAFDLVTSLETMGPGTQPGADRHAARGGGRPRGTPRGRTARSCRAPRRGTAASVTARHGVHGSRLS